MNKQPLSTMPRLHGSFIYDPETEELSDEAEYVALADTDKAGFWREVGRLANELASNDPMKKLALAFAEYGSFSKTARAFKLDRQRTMTSLRKWLKQNNLKPATGLSRTTHEKEPAPGPVRHLIKEEIAKLNLKAPGSD